MIGRCLQRLFSRQALNVARHLVLHFASDLGLRLATVVFVGNVWENPVVNERGLIHASCHTFCLFVRASDPVCCWR